MFWNSLAIVMCFFILICTHLFCYRSTMKKKIAILVGSLRKESFNKKIAQELIALAPESLELRIVPIGEMTHYNEDLDTNPPQAWVDFRNAISESDGVILVTPEYNRSFPWVMKNALDVGSRPYGASVWNGKPAAIISVSPSPLGAFGANHALRQPAVFLNMPMMQQPEAYIREVHTFFSDDGKMLDEKKKYLEEFIDAYALRVEKITK